MPEKSRSWQKLVADFPNARPEDAEGMLRHVLKIGGFLRAIPFLIDVGDEESWSNPGLRKLARTILVRDAINLLSFGIPDHTGLILEILVFYAKTPAHAPTNGRDLDDVHRFMRRTLEEEPKSKRYGWPTVVRALVNLRCYKLLVEYDVRLAIPLLYTSLINFTLNPRFRKPTEEEIAYWFKEPEHSTLFSDHCDLMLALAGFAMRCGPLHDQEDFEMGQTLATLLARTASLSINRLLEQHGEEPLTPRSATIS